MDNKELLIYQICELDETANLCCLESRTEEELEILYNHIIKLEKTSSAACAAM